MSDLLKGLGWELRKADLEIKKVKGWRQRGRPGLFVPQAVFFHHTASNRKAGNAPSLNVVTRGRSDLPGPLANFLVGRNATIYFVAAGRCNHAGAGGPRRGIPKDSGNAYALSIEAENDGVSEPWRDKQLEAVAILSAMLLRRMGRNTAYRLIGHREWAPGRKIDPSRINLDNFRNRVRKIMKHLD